MKGFITLRHMFTEAKTIIQEFGIKFWFLATSTAIVDIITGRVPNTFLGLVNKYFNKQ